MARPRRAHIASLDSGASSDHSAPDKHGDSVEDASFKQRTNGKENKQQGNDMKESTGLRRSARIAARVAKAPLSPILVASGDSSSSDVSDNELNVGEFWHTPDREQPKRQDGSASETTTPYTPPDPQHSVVEDDIATNESPLRRKGKHQKNDRLELPKGKWSDEEDYFGPVARRLKPRLATKLFQRPPKSIPDVAHPIQRVEETHEYKQNDSPAPSENGKFLVLFDRLKKIVPLDSFARVSQTVDTCIALKAATEKGRCFKRSRDPAEVMARLHALIECLKSQNELSIIPAFKEFLLAAMCTNPHKRAAFKRLNSLQKCTLNARRLDILCDWIRDIFPAEHSSSFQKDFPIPETTSQDGVPLQLAITKCDPLHDPAPSQEPKDSAPRQEPKSPAPSQERKDPAPSQEPKDSAPRQKPKDPSPVTGDSLSDSQLPKLKEEKQERFKPWQPGRAKTRSVYSALQVMASDVLKDGDLDIGVVYLYWTEADPGFVKVGSTTNFGLRMSTWKKCEVSTMYWDIEKVQVKFEYARRAESLVKEELKEFRHKTIKVCNCGHRHEEWFKVDRAYAQAVIDKWTKWVMTSPYRVNAAGEWRLKPGIERSTAFAQLCDPTPQP